MKLQLGKKFRGVKEDFFRAADHQCSFVGETSYLTFFFDVLNCFLVAIPKVRPSVYSTGDSSDGAFFFPSLIVLS